MCAKDYNHDDDAYFRTQVGTSHLQLFDCPTTGIYTPITVDSYFTGMKLLEKV
jgi:hypothetical protein